MATNQALVEQIYQLLTGGAVPGAGTRGAGLLGLRVDRAAAADIVVATNIFTIAGGHILLTGLWGAVTIIRSGGAGATMSVAWSVGPTALHTPAAAVTGNATVGTVFTCTGDAADPLIIGVGTGVANTAPPIQGGLAGSGAFGVQQFGVTLGAGSITVAHSAIGATGTTRYWLTYIPLNDGVTVVAV